VVSLSPYHFLDSSLHFIVLLGCLLVLGSLTEFLLEQDSTCFLSVLIVLNAFLLLGRETSLHLK
jgi:hypothetical protein